MGTQLPHGQNEISRRTWIMILFSMNVFAALFYSCAYQLRHSHVRLSYESLLSYVFINPAQHQIHHSADQRHLNKNFGNTFAIWDACLDLSMYLSVVKIFDLVCRMRILTITPVLGRGYIEVR